MSMFKSTYLICRVLMRIRDQVESIAIRQIGSSDSRFLQAPLGMTENQFRNLMTKKVAVIFRNFCTPPPWVDIDILNSLATDPLLYMFEYR
jgi:hypothetical protein